MESRRCRAATRPIRSCATRTETESSASSSSFRHSHRGAGRSRRPVARRPSYAQASHAGRLVPEMGQLQ